MEQLYVGNCANIAVTMLTNGIYTNQELLENKKKVNLGLVNIVRPPISGTGNNINRDIRILPETGIESISSRDPTQPYLCLSTMLYRIQFVIIL